MLPPPVALPLPLPLPRAAESAVARSEGPNAASQECGAAAFALLPCWLAPATPLEEGHSAEAEEGSSRHAAEDEEREAALLLPWFLLLLLL